jgi:AraC-like DNA-binding protein
MSISLKTIALLVPSFVTLFWAAILYLRNHSPKNPGFYIASLMLAFFAVFTSILPFYTGNTKYYLLLEPAFFLALCSIFPLTWLYVRSVTRRSAIRPVDLLHFAPAAGILIIAVLCQIMIKDTYLRAYGTGAPFPSGAAFPEKVPYLVNYLSKLVVLLQIPFYYFRSRQLIIQHRSRVDNYFSGLKNYYFNWIRMFNIAYPGASLLGLFLLVKGNRNLDSTPEPLLVLVLLILSGVFFIIAYIANHQRYIENGEFYRTVSEEKADRDQHHRIPEGLQTALEEWFETRRPYLQHDLKITDVASSLGTNRTYISQLIHDQYGTNFSGFVNDFRVKEAKRLFEEKATRNYTTKTIADAAGFNNYNSFTAAFRKTTGMTPGQYREKLTRS